MAMCLLPVFSSQYLCLSPYGTLSQVQWDLVFPKWTRIKFIFYVNLLIISNKCHHPTCRITCLQVNCYHNIWLYPLGMAYLFGWGGAYCVERQSLLEMFSLMSLRQLIDINIIYLKVFKWSLLCFCIRFFS